MKKITRLFLMPAALICLSQAAFAGPNTVWGGPLTLRWADDKIYMDCKGPIVAACYDIQPHVPGLTLWQITGTIGDGLEIHGTIDGEKLILDEEGRQIGDIEIILDSEGR